LVETNFEIDIAHSRQWIEISKEFVPTSTTNFKIKQQPKNQFCTLEKYSIESKRLFIECGEREKDLLELSHTDSETMYHCFFNHFYFCVLR
jgi:hypothetical protein